jgi:MFS family permease
VVQPSAAGEAVAETRRARGTRYLEAWFAPFALVNGSAVGLVPILLPVVSVKYGVGHVGLVMGAFNLGAFAAPMTGALADNFHAWHRPGRRALDDLRCQGRPPAGARRVRTGTCRALNREPGLGKRGERRLRYVVY